MNLKGMLNERSHFQKVTYNSIYDFLIEDELWGWKRDQELPGLMDRGNGEYKGVG